MAKTSAISDRFLTEDKQTAAPVRTYMSTINPISGPTSSPNQSIKIRLPAGRAATYLDPSASWISFKVTSNSLQVHSTMSMVGVGGFYNSVTIRNQGAVLSTLNNYQTWRALHMKTNVDENFLSHDSAIMGGTDTYAIGRKLNSAQSTTVTEGRNGYTFVDPLENLGSIFQNGKYIPLFTQDSIEIDILLGDTNYNLAYPDQADAAAHLALGNNSIVFSEITLHMCLVECSPVVDNSIIKAHEDGIFRYLTNNAACFQSYILKGAANHQMQIGASFSSINSIHIVLVNNDLTTKDHQYTAFKKGNLKNASLLIDGYPILSANGIDSADSINLAYARLAQHSLGDMTRWGHTNAGHYLTDSYVVSFDTETLFGKEKLRSGLNGTSSTMNLKLDFTSADSNLGVYVFVQYDALVSMNVYQGRNFEISI
jgi:hypothetical protein